MGLVAPQHVGSSRARARTRVPCIGRRILNHCATREAPFEILNNTPPRKISLTAPDSPPPNHSLISTLVSADLPWLVEVPFLLCEPRQPWAILVPLSICVHLGRLLNLFPHPVLLLDQGRRAWSKGPALALLWLYPSPRVHVPPFRPQPRHPRLKFPAQRLLAGFQGLHSLLGGATFLMGALLRMERWAKDGYLRKMWTELGPAG